MILLDTNVASELIRPLPASQVIGWLSRQASDDLFLSVISEAELRVGVLLMPPGQKRDKIAAAIEILLGTYFAGRVLDFNRTAARHYAEILTTRRSMGRPVSHQDAQIAAIAKANGIPLATRNTRDFDHVGVQVIDPWQSE